MQTRDESLRYITLREACKRASSTMEEPPLKRQKLETQNIHGQAIIQGPSKYLRESDVGITEFINRSSEGFNCILKYRLNPI